MFRVLLDDLHRAVEGKSIKMVKYDKKMGMLEKVN
jgi:hypothetical protein